MALCFPIYYLQNCVFLYLVPLMRYRIGNLLAYVAWLLVASFLVNLNIRGISYKVADSNPTRSRVFANLRLISTFFISLDRAAFWSCSRKCLRSAASPLCYVMHLRKPPGICAVLSKGSYIGLIYQKSATSKLF